MMHQTFCGACRECNRRRAENVEEMGQAGIPWVSGVKEWGQSMGSRNVTSVMEASATEGEA